MLGFKATKMLFFDAPAVLKAVDAATRRVLSAFGAGVRRTAIASIREAPPREHAPPGEPPRAHRAAARRRLNRARKAQGQAPLPAKGFFKGLKYILFAYEPGARSVIIGPASNRTRRITIPEILEEGKLGVAARPFMGPAFRQESPKLPALWAGSVKQ